MKTLIFGHQKPDTDSVTSAIALSYLKNKLGDKTEARVLGEINNETKFALDFFKVKAPKFLNDVRLQISDVDYVKNCFLRENNSIYDGYNYMNKTKISTIPIIDENNKYKGAVFMKDVAWSLISGDFNHINTSYDNLLKSLDGKEIFRFDDEISGRVIMPSYQAETFKEVIDVDKNTILILGDRHSIIEYVVEKKPAIIILTNNVHMKDEHLEIAKKNKINIIETRHNSIASTNLVMLSSYIKDKIIEDEVISVNVNDSLYEVLELANKVKFSNYPIIDNKGKYLGIFRANISDNKHNKKVILVDHNEKEQSVIGLDEAEIVEVVDHHKIGNIGTSFPINFRNMPLGSTNTIVYLMYKENDVEIPEKMAGLMAAGIISDTLLLSSPTTTDIDRQALENLSLIANIDYEKFAKEMFKAGSSIKGKSISSIIHGDFKAFTVDAQKFGIGQVSTMNIDEIMDQKDEFITTLNDIAKEEDYSVVALLVTDILKKGSYLLYSDKSKPTFSNAFGKDINNGDFLDGVVSRKKQIVPKVMNFLDNKN